jgi:DNA-binding MarR family transcriptional regulator
MDRADVAVEIWRAEHPGLDMTMKKLGVRLRWVTHHLERELRRELAAHDVEMWEMEVVMALRRAPGYQLSAGAILRQCQVTSGAITNRVARLEQRGWVRRDVDLGDRRQVLVTLTPDGVARANQLVALKTEAEQRIFGGIDPETRERLSDDLRSLLLSIEGPIHPDEASGCFTYPPKD